jgi:hypothetical protein
MFANLKRRLSNAFSGPAAQAVAPNLQASTDDGASTTASLVRVSPLENPLLSKAIRYLTLYAGDTHDLFGAEYDKATLDRFAADAVVGVGLGAWYETAAMAAPIPTGQRGSSNAASSIVEQPVPVSLVAAWVKRTLWFGSSPLLSASQTRMLVDAAALPLGSTERSRSLQSCLAALPDPEWVWLRNVLACFHHLHANAGISPAIIHCRILSIFSLSFHVSRTHTYSRSHVVGLCVVVIWSSHHSRSTRHQRGHAFTCPVYRR